VAEFTRERFSSLPDKPRDAAEAACLTLDDRHKSGKIAVRSWAEDVLRSVLDPHVAGFKASARYTQWLKLRWITAQPISNLDFGVYRPLGCGAFGAVDSVYYLTTGAMFARKTLNRKVRHVAPPQPRVHFFVTQLRCY